MKNPLWLFLAMIGLVFLLISTQDFDDIYYYKGYTTLPIEQALALTSEYTDETQIVTYSKDDTAYITYNFLSEKQTIYGLVGDIDYNRYYGRWIMLSVCIVILLGGIIGFIVDKKEL